MDKLKELKGIIESVEQDYEKFYGRSVKAASPRIRKAMQEVKRLAQEIRQDVQERRNQLDAQ